MIDTDALDTEGVVPLPQRPAEPLADGPEVAAWLLRTFREHPERHDQDVFTNACGTVRCTAGWIWWLDDLHLNHSTSYAARRLGLSGEEGKVVFYCASNSDAVEILEAIASGEPGAAQEAIERICEL